MLAENSLTGQRGPPVQPGSRRQSEAVAPRPRDSKLHAARDRSLSVPPCLPATWANMKANRSERRPNSWSLCLSRPLSLRLCSGGDWGLRSCSAHNICLLVTQLGALVSRHLRRARSGTVFSREERPACCLGCRVEGPHSPLGETEGLFPSPAAAWVGAWRPPCGLRGRSGTGLCPFCPSETSDPGPWPSTVGLLPRLPVFATPAPAPPACPQPCWQIVCPQGASGVTPLLIRHPWTPSPFNLKFKGLQILGVGELGP